MHTSARWLPPSFAFASSVALLLMSGPLLGQTAPEVSWQPAVESRLKAIYERGDFRPLRVRAEWLPDSSGYTIEEREPGSDKPSRVTYAALTGERIPAPSAEPSRAPRDPRRSPDGARALEYDGGALVVREVATGKRLTLLTPPADRELSYQKPTWSPDGRRVAFVEVDATDVRKRAVLDASDPSYPEVHRHRFARVGEVIERQRVGVIDSDGQQLEWLPLPSPAEGCYLGQVEWANNSDEVLVEQQSRFRNRREFFLAKTTGEPKRIFHEENEAWTDASQQKNAGLAWIRGGEEFVVVNETDGWRHAHRWSREGKALAVLTPGNYDLIDRAWIDEPGGWYYFYASPENATQKFLYRVPLDGSGTLERITPVDQPGTHDYQFSPDGKRAIHTHSRLDSPPIVDVVELPQHRSVRVLQDQRQLRERMKTVITHPTEFLQLAIGGGVTMDAWLLKPKSFDPAKKYPVFIYVYGEPHAQTVLDEWGAAQIDFHRVIADLGYLVVSIDNRGTPAPKGAAWRRAVFGSLGPLSTDEQEAGLKELGRLLPYVDLSRVGIWGWSGGGSNTLNALFRKPDSYHVGIAVVPKPQPHLYNAWFQEIFMRTREVNPDGYLRAAAIQYADGLKGDLLIVTGSGETNTHIQIIEGLVDRLIELGKRFDYMVYPNRDHGLREGNGTVVHVRMLIIRYLLEHLPAGAR
jgi:dipeptidyl-peptidase-4